VRNQYVGGDTNGRAASHWREHLVGSSSTLRCLVHDQLHQRAWQSRWRTV
jgi:hypothetical protein